MGKKGKDKAHGTKKLTKKEQKKLNHLKLMEGKKHQYDDLKNYNEDKKKAA